MRKAVGIAALITALILFGTAFMDWKEMVHVLVGAVFLFIGFALLVRSTPAKEDQRGERTFFPHNV
jgi:Na+-transporting NADH:ubiquinone oxidoreductase subunit NqrB